MDTTMDADREEPPLFVQGFQALNLSGEEEGEGMGGGVEHSEVRHITGYLHPVPLKGLLNMCDKISKINHSM
jgi:hypothetical protein